MIHRHHHGGGMRQLITANDPREGPHQRQAQARQTEPRAHDRSRPGRQRHAGRTGISLAVAEMIKNIRPELERRGWLEPLERQQALRSAFLNSIESNVETALIHVLPLTSPSSSPRRLW